MRYLSLGDVPAKRHAQTRRNGTLLTEEVLGYEGFSGNESILYHLHSPCRLSEVGGFQPIVREEWVPDAHVHRLADANPVDAGGDAISGRRLLMFNNDIEASDLQADRGPRRLLSQRRGRRGHLRPPRRRRPAHDLRRGALPREGLRRHPARDDPPLAPGRGRRAVLGLLPHAGRDRDAQPLPQPLRPAARARALLAARLPRPGRARDDRGRRRVRAHAARPRRLPELRPRPPSLRRRRLGRLRVPVHVQRDGLRAARRALPPPAARPPDLPGPELRHLHLRAADARLGRDGGPDPLPPLEHPVRGGHVLRRRRLRRAQGRGDRLPDPAPQSASPTARSPGRSRRRSAPSRRASWRSCGTPSGR